jgi:hypothetical protein
MNRTGTWSAPVLRSLLPPDTVILLPRSVYAVKPSEVANVYDLQVRTCANVSSMIEGVYYDQSFYPVSSIDSIRMMIALGAAQRKTAYTLDISNAFQTSIVFQACKRTYNSLPPFFVDYISLQWTGHPDLPGLIAQANAYAIQNFRSFQGQKDAGYFWCTLLMDYLVNTMGLARHHTDHAVFLWQTPTTELFLALATDDFLVLTDNRDLFLALKSGLEKLFKLTSQESSVLRFLNLRIIQSPDGISIDHTDHVVDSIIEPYFMLRDVSKIVRITSPFPTDTSFEQQLYESPVLTGSALRAIELKHDGSLYKCNGALLRVAITTRLDLGYAVMRLSGYLAGPTAAIFEALDHVMRYLYFYRHLPIMYPAKPLSCKSLTTHWARGSEEYLGPEFGTCFVNTSDADHARDIRDCRSTTSTIHPFNGVAVLWLCKKQSVSTLHSTGSKIIALSTGAKGTINGLAFFSGLGYPIAGATDTMEDNQATIKYILSSRIHSNTHHLATRISWLHEIFACGVIKPHYTKTSLQLSDVNTKPLCGADYHSKLAFSLWSSILSFTYIKTLHFFIYFLLHIISLLYYARYSCTRYFIYYLTFIFLVPSRHFASRTWGVLGLLRIPRYTPVPWIDDNAILALPVSVLTHAVLYTFR